jgi:hypothetical protein
MPTFQRYKLPQFYPEDRGRYLQFKRPHDMNTHQHDLQKTLLLALANLTKQNSPVLRDISTIAPLGVILYGLSLLLFNNEFHEINNNSI